MKGPNGIMSPVEMVSIFDKSVRGQEEAKRQLSIALFNRHRRAKLSAEDRKFVKKQNILIEGPTGSGKTALMRVLREDFGLPVLEVDITEYSEAGYHGKSVDDMIKELQGIDFRVPKWFNEKPPVKKDESVRLYKLETSSSFDPAFVRNKETAREIFIAMRIMLIGMVGARVYPMHVFSDPNAGSMLHRTVEENVDESPDELVRFFRRGVDLVMSKDIPLTGKFTELANHTAESLMTMDEIGNPEAELTDEFFAKFLLPQQTLTAMVSSLVNLDVADYNAIWDIKVPYQEINEWPSSDLAGDKSGFYRERLKAAMVAYFFRALIAGLIKTGASKVEDHASKTMAMQRYNGKDMVKEVASMFGLGFDAAAQSQEKLKEQVRAGMPCMAQERVIQLTRSFRAWTNQLSKLKMVGESKVIFPAKMTAAWEELKEMSFDDFWKLATAEIAQRSAKQIRDDVQHASLVFAPNADAPDFGGMTFRPMGRPMGGLGIPGLGHIFGMGGGASVSGDSKEFLENFAVVFIDEIDKLIQEPGRSGDVSRMGVQRGLLKLVEGGVYAGIDTSNILFVGAGAFSGTSPAKLLPELVGRFPIRARLKALTNEDYVAICKLERSPFNMYCKMLGTDDVKVKYDEDTFEYIAQLTELENQEFNLGARRIEGIIERVFAPAMFEPEKYLEHGFDIRGETLRKTLRG